MAIYILRPDGIGHYNSVWDIQSAGGFTTYWENINEKDQDGDANYIYATDAGPFTVDFSDFHSDAYARPCRIPSILVVATVKASHATDFRFRIRYLGIDYDSELFTVNSVGYVEVYKQYLQLPNGDGWNAVRLSDMEVGLYYEHGAELRCTKLEIQVCTEVYPHYTLIPTGAGTYSDWLVHPGVAPPYMSVETFDGDQSYIRSSTLWTSLDSPSSENLRSIFGFSATDIYAVGDAGTILHYDGLRWVRATPVTTRNLYGVWGADAANVFAVGEQGTILHWDGLVWNVETSGILQDLYAVWGASATDVWAVGAPNGATNTSLHYDGVAWTAFPIVAPLQTFYGLHGTATNNIFASGSGGTLAEWTGAMPWVLHATVPPTAETLLSVHMTAANDAWAVGTNGVAAQWNGAAWAIVASGTAQDLRSVWGSAAANYVAVGDSGTIINWDGATWGVLPSGVTDALYGVWGATQYNVFVVGATDTILVHEDIAWWPVSTFAVGDLPAILMPANIERVLAGCLVKNYDTDPGLVSTVVRSGGADYYGATGTNGKVVPADGEWHVVEDVYLNDPNTGWPSGVPAATPWVSAEVNGVELGIANRGGNLRCTSMALEVFLKETPPSTFTLVPTANGFHQGIATLFPGAGEAAWQDVDDNPPDWGATYIAGNATASGTPLYSTFRVTALPLLPVWERIYCVSHRIWLQVPAGSAVVAPVFRLNGDETYIGHPSTIDHTGADWFLLRNEFFTSPFTSTGWTLAEVNAPFEVGVVILSGTARITSVNIEVQTAPDFTLSPPPPSPTDLQLTDIGVFYMTRSKVDGTIYAVTEFAIGTWGFVPALPWSVVPVVTADLALVNEIWRGKIERISYDASTPAPPWYVKYWCRVPKEAPLGQVGELGLFATIIWSPIPAEIGTQFMFALQHMPCQCRHKNEVQLFEVTVHYILPT